MKHVHRTRRTLSQRLTNNGPILSRTLRLTSTIRSRTHQILSVNTRSTFHRRTHHGLSGRVTGLLTRLNRTNVPKTSSRGPDTNRTQQIRTLRTRVTRLRTRLTQTHRSLTHTLRIRTHLRTTRRTRRTLSSTITTTRRIRTRTCRRRVTLRNVLLSLCEIYEHT